MQTVAGHAVGEAALGTAAASARAQRSEVNCAAITELQLSVLWGDNTLHTTQLAPPRAFVVGEGAAVDYVVPARALGASRFALLRAQRGGQVTLLIPAGARASVTVAGCTQSLEACILCGVARPSRELPGAYELALSSGARAQVSLPGGLTFAICADPARSADPIGVFPSVDLGSWLCTGLSGILHLSLLAALALHPPLLAGEFDGAPNAEQRMRRALTRSAELGAGAPRGAQRAWREQGNEVARGAAKSASRRGEGGLGNTAGSVARRGGDAQQQQRGTLREAASFGMIALLQQQDEQMGAGQPWGHEAMLGEDALGRAGGMWRQGLDDSLVAGLGSKLGRGGDAGGLGRGVPIKLGTARLSANDEEPILGCGGTCSGGRSRFGWAVRKVSAPAALLQQEPATVSGRLPSSVIQRIVRQNFGRFRQCYADGLRQNPSLSGRVVVRFVIDRTGAVQTVSDAGSELSAEVVRCVVRGFASLSFPEPAGGAVSVVYPIVFSSGS